MIAAVQLHELRRISDHELHAAPIDRFAHLRQIERLQAEALTADTAVEAVDQRLPVTRGRRIVAASPARRSTTLPPVPPSPNRD